MIVTTIHGEEMASLLPVMLAYGNRLKALADNGAGHPANMSCMLDC